jgi:hypothetical protein
MLSATQISAINTTDTAEIEHSIALSEREETAH